MEKILITVISGAGKSFSLRNLKPEEVFFIRGTSKMPIAVKGAHKLFIPLTPDKKSGNMVTLTRPFKENDKGEWESQMNQLYQIAIERKFKTIVIDDVQYILLTIENIFKGTGEFKDQRRIYALIKQFTYNLFSLADVTQDKYGIQTIFLWQKQATKNELVIPGEAFNEVIVPQGFFNVVLEAETTITGDHVFRTNGMGLCKSPYEMFEADNIPNDILEVNKCIEQFYA